MESFPNRILLMRQLISEISEFRESCNDYFWVLKRCCKSVCSVCSTTSTHTEVQFYRARVCQKSKAILNFEVLTVHRAHEQNTKYRIHY